MGLLNKMAKMIGLAGKNDNGTEFNAADTTVSAIEEIVPAFSSHTAKVVDCGDNDREYLISFRVNDAFKEAKSHAGEVLALYTYAPVAEHGEEGRLPYLAIQLDDEVYHAVEEFKISGTITGAIEMTALSEKFYFKARMEYYDCMMYFYGLDRCDGYWENNGLCIVYPKIYAGTENEKKLMRILDEAAESYREERRAR